MSIVNISGLDHVALKVRDLKRSIEFYQRVFGFEIKEGECEDNWVIIGVKDKIYLCLYESREVDISRNTIYHWGFNIVNAESLNTLSQELQKQGVKVDCLDNGEDGVCDYGVSQSLYVFDPDGYVIELSTVYGGGLG